MCSNEKAMLRRAAAAISGRLITSGNRRDRYRISQLRKHPPRS
jgi:hypothetical protein